jgi:hypothetical protein
LNVGNFIYVKPSKSGGGAAATTPNVKVADRRDLLTARSQLLRLFAALQSVADLLNVSTALRLDLPDAQSTSGLGLDLSTSAATLTSTGEINASTHSFSPFGPDWANGSSALLTIGGEYDGSNGSGNLSFQVTRPGTKGLDNLRIRVRDPQGSVISNINVRSDHDPDREYGLLNGLFFTLGAGSLIDDDTTAIQVLQNVGSQFDATRPLGGVRNENPNFQYYALPDTLPEIVNGSFLLNGESIVVGPTDTMNDVITRINQSAAGVTSTYNDLTEKLEFLQNTTGSAATISLQSDSSNFLVSAKLGGAQVTPGVDPESQQALSSVAAFAAIQSGSILINGTAVSIDASSDSLETVVAKINSSAAGVNAAFDPQSQRVRIEANDPSSIFEIDGNGTGLFDALKIPEGRVDPTIDGRGVSRRRSYDIADSIEFMMSELNALFRDSNFVNGADQARVFRARLESAVSDVFDAQATDKPNVFGLVFDRSDSATRHGRFAELERRDFTQNLQRRGEVVRQLLAGTEPGDGLIGHLFAATQTALLDINKQLGLSASAIDIFA